MSDVAEIADLSVLDDFKQHYEGMGYRLLRAPVDDQLPDFLRGMRPDAIARRGKTEGIVIGIRQLGDKRQDIQKLAEAVAKVPGWSLDIVLTDRKFPRQSYLLPSNSEIRSELGAILADLERNETGRNAIGSNSVLLLHAWPLFEAAARRAIIDAGIAPPSDLVSSKGLIEASISQDLISDDDAEFLTRLLLVHGKVVHGFLRGDTKASDIRQLARIVESLAH